MTTKLAKRVSNICKEYANEYDSGMAGFIEDLHRGGCVSGLIGQLTYYADTVAFYNKFEDDIWQLVWDEAIASNSNTIMEFIASLNGASDVNSGEQFKNLLAWFAFEETAFSLFDD